MTITHTGFEPDRLIGGSVAQACRFAVHGMKMDGQRHVYA